MSADPKASTHPSNDLGTNRNLYGAVVQVCTELVQMVEELSLGETRGVGAETDTTLDVVWCVEVVTA